MAIGLEMFRRDSQADLDRWTAGELPPGEFEKVYARNWNYPWPAYSAIFEYARARHIPMLGLNVPPDITRQVARNGFQSLTETQRGALSDVTCSIDEEYMRYIREVFGAHAHGHGNFTFFCEAQMVWDTAMAVHALDYLRTHPDATAGDPDRRRPRAEGRGAAPGPAACDDAGPDGRAAAGDPGQHSTAARPTRRMPTISSPT